MDSFDMSSDSEGVLDEVLVHHSPIHLCDNSIHSDDNNASSSSAVTTSSASASTSSGAGASTSGCSVGRCIMMRNNVEGGNCSSSSCGINSSGGATAFRGVQEETTTLSSFNNQLTADMCSFKNSKSRRLEYSLKCLKYGRSNPSQDSAFGSLTDTDLSIGSSSFRLSSFQSITSPIDEGVEDVIIASTSSGNEISLELTTTAIDSALSTPCREGSPNFLMTDDAFINKSPMSLSPKINYTSSSTSNLQFDPPKILVNDQNSIYTTSPSKRSGTIEVFSQKYRVCSFEDMSPNKRNLKSVNRMAFRSLEEEQRIDSAFMPITDRTKSENRVNVNSEKYKKLTHTSFLISKNKDTSNSTERCASSCSTSSENKREKYTLWRDSIFYRKTKMAKSNDSLLDSPPATAQSKLSLLAASLRDNHFGQTKSLNRGKSAHEITTSSSSTSLSSNSNGYRRQYVSEDLIDIGSDERRFDSRKSASERHLVSVGKLKQTSIVFDCVSDDEGLHDNKPSPPMGFHAISRSQTTKSVNTLSSSSQHLPAVFRKRAAFKSLDIELNDIHRVNEEDDDEADDDDDADSSDESTPLHQDMCKRIGGMTDTHRGSCSEEKTPLLDSVEMSPISPTAPDLTM